MQLFIVLLLVAAIVGGVIYFIKRNKSPSVTDTPVAATGWTFQYNGKGFSPTQMSIDGDTYFFDFPVSDGVHYVVQPAKNLQLGQTVTLDFNVQGTGNVIPVQGTPPAKVSLYIQRAGDNLSGAGSYQQYRYFHPSADLVNGDGTISTTLEPGNWGDVFGAKGSDFPDKFKECLTNAAVIGFVFGDPGAGATGHGAYVQNGSARFTLKSFTIK